LLGAVNDFIPLSKRLSSAVGFLFLSGLRGISERLSDLDDIRFLIGNTSTQGTTEQIAEGYKRHDVAEDELDALRYAKRSERLSRTRHTGESIRESLELMDQTDDAESLVQLLIELITTHRLRVRVYTRGRLSGRAHIFDFADPQTNGNGASIVGSSNLTLTGIEDHTELNVVIRDSADATGSRTQNHAALTTWFDRLWDDSQNFDAVLLEELQTSWAACPASPWDVYMKTLYTLVKERLDQAADEALFDDDITRSLADFQRVAVQQAVGLIRRFNGCFVADVVGLGKSYIGAAVVKHFERSEGRRALVVCPKPLEEMWLQYNERYALNAAVVPMSMLMTTQRGVDLFEQYPGRDFVLIDESHSFRNASSQRYEALATYLQADDRKVCLLTATPRNSRAWDVFNQIKLFHPDDETDLPIDPPDLRVFFKEVEDDHKQLRDVLRHLMIRRTRRHILRWWGIASDTRTPLVELGDDEARPYLNGERRCFIKVGDMENYFPRRELRTLRYSIEDTYEGLYAEIRAKVGGASPAARQPGMTLTYARYGLWSYLRPELRDEDRYADLRRTGKSLRGLIRVMLFKRLESSVAAFRDTLRRLLQRHELFIRAVEDGMIPAGEDAEALLGKAGVLDDEEVLGRLAAITQNYYAADFQLDQLTRDLRNDVAVLQSLLGLTDPITPESDDKVQTLIRTLNDPAVKGRKVLLFTQYSDTAKYLGTVLNPNDTIDDIEVMYGQEKSKARVVGRFAPKANADFTPRAGETDIRILITTDVLSEGLNMQDCDLVINYDLHWNPVRLIQRLGRIDRIGSEHDTIEAMNFLPETGIEQHLGILAILRDRIAEIHETIGEDAQILEESERVNEDAMFAIYEEDATSLDEAEDAEETLDLNEAEEVLRRLEREDPDEFARIAALRDGIRSTKPASESGLFALCKAGEFLHPVVVDNTGKIVTRDLCRILNLVRAERTDVAPATLPPDFNQLLHGVKTQFADNVKARAARRGHVARLSTGQRYIIDELNVCITTAPDEGRQALLETLKRAYGRTPTPAVRRELQRLKKNELTGQKLIDALQELYTRHRLHDRSATRQSSRIDVPRIICGEALLQVENE